MSSRAPNPPETRSRRRRVGLWICVGLLLLLVLGHHVWTSYERNRLLAAVQRYRQAGEPVLPEDFAPPANEDPDNPVLEWRAAFAALKPLDPELQKRADWKELSDPLTQSEDQFLREVLDGQDEALAHAAKASRMRGRPQWGIHFVSPAINSMFPDFTEQRRLAHMLQRSALDAHFHGDDALAVDRLLQIVRQSRALQHHPTLVAHLVGIGVEAIACDTARTIGPELRIGSSPGASVHPASQEQVHQLTAELLNEQPLRDGQVLAYRSERMMEVDSAVQMAAGTYLPAAFAGGGPKSKGASGTGALAALLAPQFYNDGRIMLEYTSGVLKASQAADLPACRAQLSALPDVNAKRGASHLLLSIFLPAFGRAVEQDFRILTDDRLTASQLACRMYALDHGGEFPAKLDDLVPNYLPSVPPDPFATGATLRYRPGPDPVVYSVGGNGIDDGGSEQRTNTRGMDDRWGELDVVTHLTLQPHQAPPEDPADTDAPPSPATQPATAPTTVSEAPQ